MPYKIFAQRVTAAVCAIVCLVAVLAVPLQAQKIVISQVYGGGGNIGATLKNDFIELFNAGTAAQNLNGWSVQYASSTGSYWQKTNLSGTILPGHYYLVQEAAGSGGTVSLPTPDAIGTLAMSGTTGKVALVNNQVFLTGTCPTDVIDFVGFGSANCSETAPTPALSNTTAALRNGGGCADTGNNSADFTVGAPNPRNSASGTYLCAAMTNPTGVGAAAPTTVDPGSPVTFPITVTPGANPTSTGVVVTADLSAIGGSAVQAFYDDGTNGDAVAGDLVFTFTTTVANGTSQGLKTLAVTITDAQARTGAAQIQVTVNPPPPPVVPIHDIQGEDLASPLANTKVSTSGIVTAVDTYGFFIQTPDNQVDADPNTSEGVYVYTGRPVPTAAGIGNEVQVTGTVQEYVPSGYPATLSVTEIGGTVSVKLVSTGNTLPAAIALTASDFGTPPDRTLLEKYEGMLVSLGTVTSVGPTGGSSTSDGAFYAVLSGTARTFREPGLLAQYKPPSMPDIPVFDDNQERFVVDTSGLASPLEISSGTTVGNVSGVLDTNGFSILVPPGTALSASGGMTPAAVRLPGNREFTVATFNLLNFGSSGVTATRVAKATAMIRDLMRLPDIVGVEEMKDLATLQLLADALNAGASGVSYAPYIGTTGGTQKIGFLVDTSRVQVSDVTEVGADVQFYGPTSANPSVYAWYTTFDRAPLVMHATVTPPVGQPFPITVIVNHLRSLLDIDDSTKGPFVWTKREAGAEWLATYINGLQSGGEHVITIGDFNAYQFNDGYVDVVGTLIGAPTPIGYAVLTSPDLVDPDLTDLVNSVAAAYRYSYVEEGNAQAIDHVLATGDLLTRPYELEYARNDSDFPSSYLNRADHSERVSDHDPAVAYFTFPPPQADMAITIAAASTPVMSGQGQSYTITVSNNGPDPAANVDFEDATPGHTTFQSLAAPAGWTCTTPAIGGVGTVSCTASSLAAGASAQFTLKVAVNCAVADGAIVSDSASVSNDYNDPVTTNNSATAAFTVSNPPPALANLTVDKPALWPPNHKLIAVFLSYTVSDNCGTPALALAVASNQPLNGAGDGNTASDWQVIDAHHVLLRAERAPTSAAGRTYTLTVTATDSMGSSSQSTVNVVVPR